MSKENNVENKTVLEKAILEYKQILEVAKEKIAESHTKELDEAVSKLINENNLSLQQEPEMVKEEESLETIEKEPEEGDMGVIDMKDATMKEIEEAFDAANDEDEFQVVKTDDNNEEDFSLTDIEGEISEVMSEIEAAENINGDKEGNDDPEAVVDNLTKIKEIHEEMGKMIEAMDSEKNEVTMKEQFHNKMIETFGKDYDQKFGMDECGRMFETWKTKMNEDVPVENEAPAVENEEPVEEGHGISLSHNKTVNGTVAPQLDNKDYAKNKVRLALQKEQNEKLQKRINSLVKENFELVKSVNKTKESMKEMTKINESYKNAIDKYRKQLNEMALVSTNIANVNSILVNEGLALSFEDKKSIINDFKKVVSLEESDKTYKKIIKEFSETKKTIKEAVEEKINTAIESSSSNEVTKGIEETQINEHVNKLKKLISYTHKN